MKNAREKAKRDFFTFDPCAQVHANFQQICDNGDDDDMDSGKEGLLFFHETKWQRRLLNRYGTDLSLLYALIAHQNMPYSTIVFPSCKNQCGLSGCRQFCFVLSQASTNIEKALKVISIPDWLPKSYFGLKAMKKTEEDNSSKLVPPKLTTFRTKKTAASKAQNLAKIYQDESSVSRALCFFKSSEEHTREAAFSHEWTAYLSSLFEVDPRVEKGYAMRKGAKSNYLTASMSLVTPEALNLQSVFLVDAMAFVNRFQYLGAKTFTDITGDELLGDDRKMT